MNDTEFTKLKTGIASLILVLILGFVQFTYSQADQTALIDNFISRQAKREKAEEYREARKSLYGDVNHDGRQDLVVIYTLEGFDGSNLYLRYLAVFLRKGKSFQYAANSIVGGKGHRDIELRSIKNGKIHFDTMEYRPADGMCCPSKKAKALYAFVKGRLKEIR